MACWVIDQGGVQIRVDRSGLVLGRRSDCGVVLVAPEVSRYHALVRETARGAELVHLGRTSTWVDGVEVTDIAALVDGATIEIGGAAVGVALSPGAPEGTTWMLDSAGGARYGITSAPFRVGGSTTDDVVLSDWPPTAASLFPHR